MYVLPVVAVPELCILIIPFYSFDEKSPTALLFRRTSAYF